LVATKPGELKLGFIGKGFGFGHWFVHSKGRCEWVVGDEPPPVSEAHDPDYHPAKTTDIEGLLDSKPVDVVVFFNQIPGCRHSVWSASNTQTVMWVSTKQLRKGTKFTEGWCGTTGQVTHNQVEGVTNGRFWISTAIRTTYKMLSWKQPVKAVSNTLIQVIDQKLSGRQAQIIGGDNYNLENTALGLLNWHTRFGQVTVPSVYSKLHWSRRKLSDKELADALDIPVTISQADETSHSRKSVGPCIRRVSNAHFGGIEPKGWGPCGWNEAHGRTFGLK
jgi:hypothetical protein